MEKWQRKHITENLPELIPLTEFNVIVKAGLVAKNILAKADIDKLDAVHTQHGKSDSTYHYYQFLMGRTNAYKILTKVLLENRQTGAARMLMAGVPSDVSEKPLTYLDIPIKWDEFKEMEIEVNGKKLKLHEFLPTVNYEKLQQIFQETVSELELYDTFVAKEKTFVLARNTVPPKPSIYLPRFLSNRIKIEESIFKADCPDVFVFKNRIARYKLSEIAKPHFTDTSTSQLNKITCRFIYLDENEDWTELKKLTKVPIHLINYESDGNHFLLEDTTGASNILRELGSRNKSVYMTEEDFVQQLLSEDCTSSSVCICDSPGMGKTFLLASIARLMTEKCTGRIIVFIQLSTFAKDCFPASPNTIIDPETSLTIVLGYIGRSQQNSQLLGNLIRAQLLQLEIFFDGFDEIYKDNVHWMKHVFKSITTHFSNVRIYITSRPHMRQCLETSLGVGAYDILPFNKQNQVDFLVQFWKNREPNADQPSLRTYATSCLEAVNRSLTTKDKEIAGIPLLCQLIAEVYADKLALLLMKRKKVADVPLKVSGMYQRFIEMKINLASNNREEFKDIKLVHIWHALKLIFPKHDFYGDSQFENIGDLQISPAILNAGILQKHSNAAIEFIHRTFAEYLVAEYFVTKLQDKKMQKTEQVKCNYTSIFKFLLEIDWEEFVHPVIVAFFDSALGEVNISEEPKNRFAKGIYYFSSKELISLLCACCEHNLLNIFLFLGEALTNWDKTWILECFTAKNCYQLLDVCIKKSTSQMFHSCIQLVTEVLKFDVAQINTFDKDYTLLQIATKVANYEAVEYFMNRVPLKNQSLLEHCVRLSHKDIGKRENILQLLLNKDPALIHETPDILFTLRLDVRLFKILVNVGTNLTAVDRKSNNCAMHAAIYMSPSDYHELVQFLLTDCKAEHLFLENEKWSHPLRHIIKWITLLPETMELLFGIPGMDTNMTSRWEQPLLFSAVEGNKMTNVEQLVKSGVDYNARGLHNESLLHAAAMYGGVEMVRYLLSLKLDPNSRSGNGWTPLHYAAFCAKFSVVEVLVKNGTNIQDKNNGHTALYFPAKCRKSGTKEIIRLLIRKGAVMNDRDNYLHTPLQFSCQSKEVMDCLIEMGADINAKNNDGQNVLHVLAGTALTNSEEGIKYLIGNGLEVNDRDNEGNTPLHFCKIKKVKDCLIELGADIHARNKKGKTPAHENPDLWKSSN